MSNAWDGRWIANEYVWSCQGCGCVLCAPQRPDDEEARCLGCRVEVELGRAQRLIRDLVKDRDGWMARARKAEGALDEACDQIHELKEQLEKGRAA